MVAKAPYGALLRGISAPSRESSQFLPPSVGRLDGWHLLRKGYQQKARLKPVLILKAVSGTIYDIPYLYTHIERYIDRQTDQSEFRFNFDCAGSPYQGGSDRT